jgi:peptide/nickel transport system permease protein
MLTYVARRIFATIPVMAVVALFVLERIRASLGLDRPFLIRFGELVWHILHGGPSLCAEQCWQAANVPHR